MPCHHPRLEVTQLAAARGAASTNGRADHDGDEHFAMYTLEALRETLTRQGSGRRRMW